MPIERSFSIKKIRKSDLNDESMFALNEAFRQIADQVSRVQGLLGAFTFGEGPLTMSNAKLLPRLSMVLPTYPDNATAKAAGLVADDVYKTVTGVVMVVI